MIEGLNKNQISAFITCGQYPGEGTETSLANKYHSAEELVFDMSLIQLSETLLQLSFEKESDTYELVNRKELIRQLVKKAIRKKSDVIPSTHATA